jgi:hypothetical protein
MSCYWHVLRYMEKIAIEKERLRKWRQRAQYEKGKGGITHKRESSET